MKTLVTIFWLIVALFLCTNISIAQKVKYDNDTVKADGKPYAIMKKKFIEPLRNDFIVSGLSGTELIYFKSELRPYSGAVNNSNSNKELYYEVTFIATGSRADLKFYYGPGLAKLIVENNLVKGNTIDPEAEKRFIQINNGYTPSTANTQTPDNSAAVVVNINNNVGTSGDNNANTNQPVAVKSTSPIILNGNKITRDDKVIGKFRQDTTSSTYSQKTVVITIYSEAGEKIAEASVPFINPREWTIIIISENKSYNIMYDTPGERENLFRWLADKNYLTY
jgi:hypothetical protein